MLHDACLPAPAAPAVLKLMLQEMQQHDHKVALDGFLLATAQVLDLLDQVHDIEALEIPWRRSRACSSTHGQKSRS